MCKTYITPSLLDCFYNGYDWISMIKREEKETNLAMQNGVTFEKNVMEGKIEELKEEINDSLYQVMCYGNFHNYFLFGFADFVKYNKIIDIKFKKNYELHSYYNSNQYLIYTTLLDIDNFSYIIGTGTNPNEPSGIYYEDYIRDDDLLLLRLKQFDKAIDRFDLRKIYEENYSITRLKDKYNVTM